MKEGRANPQPSFRVDRTAAATAVIDAANGPGHAAAYTGMNLACDIARESSVGIVGNAGSVLKVRPRGANRRSAYFRNVPHKDIPGSHEHQSRHQTIELRSYRASSEAM
jgi:hypothetical protein